MDVRKVEKRFIDVRNPDHTIQKAIRIEQDGTPEEVEARLLAQRGNPPPYDKDFDRTRDDCPICLGSGIINREKEVDVRFEGDGRAFPEPCYACGGSGKFEDYLKWKNKQPKQYERGPEGEKRKWMERERGRRDEQPPDEYDWIET